MQPPSSSVTELLDAVRDGDPSAQRLLYARLYPEIKRVARARLASSGPTSGLNATALANEGFLRIAEVEKLEGRTRGEFLAYVGRVLRSIVIDQIRAESTNKRDAGVLLTLSAAEQEPAVVTAPVDLIAIDRALQAMQRIDPPLYELVEMLHFAGVPIADIAALRGVARRTVERDVAKARALLGGLMDGSIPGATSDPERR